MKTSIKTVLQFTIVNLLGAILLTGCQSTPAGKRADANKPYPLATCLVTDDKLGSADETTVFVHQGQEIKLCCEGCKEDFDKDPAKYTAKLQNAGK